MDFSSIEVNNNIEKEKKLQKQILQRIKKERYRNHIFKFLIKYISRGVNGSLKRVYAGNKEGEITKTYLKKEEIEDELIKYNCYHYQKVFDTLIYNDTIYDKL